MRSEECALPAQNIFSSAPDPIRRNPIETMAPPRQAISSEDSHRRRTIVGMINRSETTASVPDAAMPIPTALISHPYLRRGAQSAPWAARHGLINGRYTTPCGSTNTPSPLAANSPLSPPPPPLHPHPPPPPPPHDPTPHTPPVPLVAHPSPASNPSCSHLSRQKSANTACKSITEPSTKERPSSRPRNL